jgi:hypothetical protein
MKTRMRCLLAPIGLVPALVLAAALAAALAGCAKNPLEQLSDDAVRKQVVDALLANQAARQEITAILLAAPGDRAAILDRLLADDAARAAIVRTILADDRGKALVVTEVTADDKAAKTFIRMLMTTGVMGTSLSQRQADALGYGEAYAFGNRRRTISDLKRLGGAVDAWAREHEGRYPPCASLDDVHGCLARKLPPETLASLRTADAWGAPFQYRSAPEGSEYILLSLATDGMSDGLGRVGPTEALDCDIVFSNGNFVQWPGSLRLEDIP